MTGFGDVLAAEWTKFRTVRGWLVGLIVGAILMTFMGVFLASNASIGCMAGNRQESGRACLPHVPIGPGGEAVQDSFYFVRRQLTGDGTITARLTSLVTRSSAGGQGGGQAHPAGGGTLAPPGQRVVVPWAKGGIIIKASLKQGSAYAAMLATGSNGVRFQYDYTGDVAGLPGNPSATSPRWLRLRRAGDTITGYDSRDGRTWTQVGSVTLAGLPRTVQIGLFAASPPHFSVSAFFGGAAIDGASTTSTATITDVRLTGAVTPGWTGDQVGVRLQGPGTGPGNYREQAGTFTIAGTGDIAPVEPGPGGGNLPSTTIEQNLIGAFAAMIAIVVVAAMYFTAEYRRGVIKVTLAAAPRRGQVLAAKAIVAGAAAFVVGIVASIPCVIFGERKARAQGQFVLPVSFLTEARVIVGTAILLAIMAVLAVSLGALLRRSAVAITIGIVVIVLPFLFAVLGIFPANVSDWLLRLTPAAGFAIQQSIPHYPQIATVSVPGSGVYPLVPWAGFCVLLAWGAAGFWLALAALRRRDA